MEEKITAVGESAAHQGGRTVMDGAGVPEIGRKVAFPPPCSWYQPHVGAARDDMWGYIAMSSLVVVRPSPWEKLPIQDTPLVSGCSGGYVRLWNLKTGGVHQYHDAHKPAGQPPQGFSVVVQWSPKNASLIYSADSNGYVSIWDITKDYARALQLGKVAITCLAVSPFEDDIIAIGSKAGHVMIVNTLGQGKILTKMRHDEEVYSVSWKPEGIWGALTSTLANPGFEEPFLISSVSTMKPSTIRVWDRQGKDIAILRPVEKEEKKMSKNFLPALWACDTFSEATNGETRLQLIASGRQGELISWSESATVADEIHGLHTNYTIFGVIQCGDVLWSLSYEPMIVGWNLGQNHVEAVIPTFRGVCSLQASPLDHTRVAMGGMDTMIRIIGMDSGYPEIAPSKVPTITARLKGKVTALAWHPVKENRLGFGTDEGVLGIYDWKPDNKFVTTFDKRVNGTIYTLDWGPRVYLKDSKFGSMDSRHSDKVSDPNPTKSASSGASAEPDEEKFEKLLLYACGGQAVHMINPTKLSSSLINVSNIISKSNSTENAEKKKNRISDVCTDVKWSPDYSYLAVGYNDGRIELYSAPHLVVRCWIKCHGRGIQFMAWRTTDFQQLTKSDSYWFASASNDGTARLFNLGYLFSSEFKDNQEAEVHQVISSVSTLNGHAGLRVLSLAWSRHNPDLIVTVSYDRTAIVWNAATGERIARYTGHQHRLVGCMFHPTDPYKVITTSDELTTDFSVHVWDYRCHPYIGDVKRAAKECALLVEKSDPVKIKSERLDKSTNDAAQQPLAEERELKKVVHVAIKQPVKEEKPQPKKKPRSKSLLPLSANALINSKLTLEDELRFMIDKTPMPALTNGSKSSVPENEEPAEGDSTSVVSAEDEIETINDPSFHLGVLGTPEECVRFVQIEKEGHIRNKKWDSAMYLANILAVGSHENLHDIVKLAIKNRTVNETLLLIASKHSSSVYEEAVLGYIEQLIQAEEYNKAATYYMLLDKVDEAIELLKNKKFYRESVMLSKCTLPPELLSNDLFEKWIDKAIDGGNLELACKLCCAIERYDQALSIIGMRNFPYAWKTGLYLAMKINDLTKAESFGLKYLEDAIVKSNYEGCFQAIGEFDILKWFLPIILVHQVLADIAKDFEQKELYDEKSGNVVATILDKWATKNILDDKTFFVSKIKSLLLLAIPQNMAEAQILISKNIVLMLLEDGSDKNSLKESSLQLAHQWIESKQPALAAATADVLSKMSP